MCSKGKAKEIKQSFCLRNTGRTHKYKYVVLLKLLHLLLFVRIWKAWTWRCRKESASRRKTYFTKKSSTHAVNIFVSQFIIPCHHFAIHWIVLFRPSLTHFSAKSKNVFIMVTASTWTKFIALILLHTVYLIFYFTMKL